MSTALLLVAGWLAMGWLAGRLYLTGWRNMFGSIAGELGVAIILTIIGPAGLLGVAIWRLASADLASIPVRFARIWGVR